MTRYIPRERASALVKSQNATRVYELVYGNILNKNCGTQSGNSASFIVEFVCNPQRFRADQTTLLELA